MSGHGPSLGPRARPRRATAAVELALTLPLILWMLIGLWEVGRVVEVQQFLFNAAREAARQAATGQYTNAQVQQIALNYLKIGLNDTSGNMTKNAAVTVVNLSAPGSDVSNATTLDLLQVSVTVPYTAVQWTALTLVTNSSTTLSSQAVWVSLIDTKYPTTVPQPPSG
jgi:Flp pilus assembly protein TadG